ncbi:hypothetical protein Tco_1208609, partial [Tanacetum coccineum]
IMEYFVKITVLKNIVLTFFTPYPSRKIRRICACTSQETTKNKDLYAVSRRVQYALLLDGGMESFLIMIVEDVYGWVPIADSLIPLCFMRIMLMFNIDQTGMYNRMGDDGVPCGYDFQAVLVYEVLGIMRDDGTRSCMMWFIIGLRSTKRSVSRLFESWLEWMDAYFAWVKQGPFYDGYDDWKFYERYKARVTMTGANAEYVTNMISV